MNDIISSTEILSLLRERDQLFSDGEIPPLDRDTANEFLSGCMSAWGPYNFYDMITWEHNLKRGRELVFGLQKMGALEVANNGASISKARKHNEGEQA